MIGVEEDAAASKRSSSLWENARSGVGIIWRVPAIVAHGHKQERQSDVESLAEANGAGFACGRVDLDRLDLLIAASLLAMRVPRNCLPLRELKRDPLGKRIVGLELPQLDLDGAKDVFGRGG
jgi:hypothetical protein